MEDSRAILMMYVGIGGPVIIILLVIEILHALRIYCTTRIPDFLAYKVMRDLHHEQYGLV